MPIAVSRFFCWISVTATCRGEGPFLSLLVSPGSFTQYWILPSGSRSSFSPLCSASPLVEDLRDEYDPRKAAEDLFRRLNWRDYLASVRAALTQLAESLGVEFPARTYSTLADSILHKTGSIPPQGARIDECGCVLTVPRIPPSRPQGNSYAY